MENQESDKYLERHNRWSAVYIDQFSFANNLFLTISIAFIAFLAKESNVNDITITITNIDLNMISFGASLLCIILSIFFGFLTVLCRLYDFRITRQIILIRKRLYEYNKIKLPANDHTIYNLLKSCGMYCKLLFERYPKITSEQCKCYNKDNNELFLKGFKELQAITYNLGLSSFDNCRFSN